MSATIGSDRAIVVRNIGKRYRVGSRRGQRLAEKGARDPSIPRWRHGRDGWIWALRHVDLDVARGEIHGVIGRNGSGKTTLLKILAGVTAPTAGTARLLGQVTALLQVGAGFHPDLTGRDNIALNGAIMGLDADQVAERFDSIASFSEIGRYLDEPVRHYSSGMYARLAFSVAAFLPADIMLIDEVLAVGDAAFKEKAQAHMLDTLRDGRTVVYVGHDAATIKRICDHATVLEHGGVAFTGTAEEAGSFYREEIVNRVKASPGDLVGGPEDG